VNLLVRVDVVNSDEVISETGIEFLSVSAPGEAGSSVSVTTLSWLSFLLWLFSGDVEHGLVRVIGKIEDLNASFSGGSDPLHLWVEGNLVDGGVGLELSGFLLEIREIPNFDAVFFTSGGDVSTHWGNGEGVDVGFVSLEAVLDEEVGVPDLKSSVPTSGGEEWSLLDWGVSDGADPVGVVVFFEGEFAFSNGVPELYGLVSTGGDDLSVVIREAA